MAIAARRNDRLGARRLDLLDKRIAVVCFVSNLFFRVAAGDQSGALGDIMILSRRQNDFDRLPQAVACYMNLRTESNSKTPRSASCNFSMILWNTPLLHQRLKR